MKQKLTAPLAAVIATLISVGRLGTITQTTFVPGLGPIGGNSIIEYLFGNAGTLEPNVSLHLLFATVVLWMIAFSVIWFLLALISRDPMPTQVQVQQ